MSPNTIDSLGLDVDDTTNYAAIVYGRRIGVEELEALEATPAMLASIAAAAADFGEAHNLNMKLVLMCSSANWSDDPDEPIDCMEANDVVVGALLSISKYPGPPQRVSKADMALPAISEALWGKLREKFGVALSAPEELLLAPSGWSIAEIHDPSADIDDAGEWRGEPQSALVSSTTDDEPAGALLDLDALPDSFWLRAYYL